MKGLSTDLYNRCRTILLRCDEFNSYTSLVNIFVTDYLVPYRDGLPQADNPSGLVDNTIAHLLPKRSSDERLVFPLFLALLRERRAEGDALRGELERLCSEIGQELVKAEIISIPFVTVAMTHMEANRWFGQAASCSSTGISEDIRQVRSFNQALQEYNIDNQLACYGELREDWKPNTCGGKTVQEIISDIFIHINQLDSPGLPLVTPRYFSKKFFAENEDVRSQTWDDLGKLGCVLVVDAVSLFHPLLRDMLRDSAITTHEKRVAMIVLSPVNSSDNQVNQLIEQQINSKLLLAFKRFDKKFDRLCEIGVGDLRALSRRLVTIVPEVATIMADLLITSGRKRFREIMGEDPTGIDEAIFRQQGKRQGEV